MPRRTVALAGLALLVVAGCTGEPGSPSEEKRATPSAELSVDGETGSLEDQQAAIDALDEATQAFGTAYSEYLTVYQTSALGVLLREMEPALDSVVEAWEAWKSELAHGGSLGVEFPGGVDEAMVGRFAATMDEWLANQREQIDALDRCGLSAQTTESEMLACMMDNKSLIREGDRLGRRLTELLQALVLAEA